MQTQVVDASEPRARWAGRSWQAWCHLGGRCTVIINHKNIWHTCQTQRECVRQQRVHDPWVDQLRGESSLAQYHYPSWPQKTYQPRPVPHLQASLLSLPFVLCASGSPPHLCGCDSRFAMQ